MATYGAISYTGKGVVSIFSTALFLSWQYSRIGEALSLGMWVMVWGRGLREVVKEHPMTIDCLSLAGLQDSPLLGEGSAF